MIIRISKIDVKKLFGFLSYTYEFDCNQNIQILTGPNGLGKTTLLKLFQFCFTISNPKIKKYFSELHNGNIRELDEEKYGIVGYEGLNKENVFANLTSIIGDLYFESITFTFSAVKNTISFCFEKNPNQSNCAHDRRIKMTVKHVDNFKESYFCYWFYTNHFLVHKNIFLDGEIGHGHIGCKCDYLSASRIETNIFNEFINSNFLPFLQKKFNFFDNELSECGLPGFKINSDFSKKIDSIQRNFVIKNGKSYKNKLEIIKNNISNKTLEDVTELLQLILCDISKIDNVSIMTEIEEMTRSSKLNDFLNKYKNLVLHFENRFKNSLIGKTLFYSIKEKKFYAKQLSNNSNSFQPYSIDKLSSGELNDLVVFYNIIFGDANTMIVDEPEVSLHIAWQLSYINEIESLLNNENFGHKTKYSQKQIIIATHSPYIIGTDDDHSKYLALLKYGQ